MLLEFIRQNRAELIRSTREKVRARASPRATQEELETGVPLFLTQFTDLLAATNGGNSQSPEIDASATLHGNDLLRRGFSIAQVVHDYGDLCQAITELAGQQQKQFSASEFHTFNLCLDNAIAGAVTEYSRQREQNLADEEVERLGFLAHELRNLLSTATMAFHVLRSGTVAIGGSTGAVLDRSLTGLRRLVDRSLAEVRLTSGQHRRTRVLLAEFIEEMEVTASLDAKARDLDLTVAPVEHGVGVDVDRELLASALSNLLQNAFKFTHPRGEVVLRTRTKGDRVFIDVEDECGGLPQGKAEELFRPFERRGTDRSGLGLGLAISRKSIGASGGEIQVQNMPGKGCVFTIDLPVAAQPPN
jgi:signal transduction histidine kinase